MTDFEKKFEEWHRKDGTYKLTKPSEIEKYLNMNRTELDVLTGKDLDFGILCVSQYLIYISNEMGIVEAYRNYIEDIYENKIQELASKIDNTKHKTHKDRIAIVLENNIELKELREKLEIGKMRYSKIKYLCDAIKELAHAYKKILERRIKTNEWK
jgi:hypothetical protein